MARKQVGCAICGAGIIQNGPGWMGEFRALYTFDRDWADARLSGIGSRLSQWDLAPRDATARYDEHDMGSPDLVDDIFLLKVSHAPLDPGIPQWLSPPVYRPGAWGFPFHAACWLLMAGLFDHQVNRQFFFDLLLSLPIANGFLDWGHDYGGLLQTNDQISTLLPGEEPVLVGIDAYTVARSETGDPIYTFDPLAVKQLLEITDDFLPASAQQGSSQNSAVKSRTNILDPFAKLPTELVQLIFNTMQSRDVVNLKVASRVAAATALTESFWATRFRRGFEFEDFFEISQQRSPQSYWKTYSKIQLLKDHPTIQNRRRISRLIVSLRILVTKYSFSKCFGQAVPSFFEPNVSASSLDREIWQTAARAVVNPEEIFRSGCTVLRYRQAQLPSTIPAVCVSFIEFNSTHYISGLRFVSEAGDDVQLGYIQHKHELRISLDADEANKEEKDCRIIAFRVAMDVRGLRAIAIATNRGASLWCGAHEGLPKSQVTVKAGFGARIRTGFDAIKIVSLAVSSGDVPTTEGETPATAIETGTSSLRERVFWLPDVPPANLQLDDHFSGAPWISRLQRPYGVVLFGGVHGERLPHLVQLVLWIFDETRIYGIEFIYDVEFGGQKVLQFGRRGAFEDEERRQMPPFDSSKDQRIAFDIDGPGGERINRVLVCNDSWGEGARVRICTNFGRETTSPEDYLSIFGDEEENWLRLVESSENIVGLYGILVTGVGVKALGVISLKPSDVDI